MLVHVFLCFLGFAHGFEDKTVAQYLADNPSRYSTLSGLLNAAGLTSVLAGSGPFTILAPTNAAFSKLAQPVLNELSGNIAKLDTVLKYHVINEFVLTALVHQPTQKPTLEGQAVNITSANGSLRINGVAQVDLPPNNDIIVNNGIVQPIDTVLFPTQQGGSNNIAQLLLKDDTRFQDMSLAIILADLVKDLESGNYTVFAPVDSAFAVYKNNLLDPAAPNALTVYREVLRYHVVPGVRRANQLKDGEKLYTLHGTTVNIAVGPGVTVNTAHVIDADILASNGVIHAIDKLLIPPDINQIVQG